MSKTWIVNLRINCGYCDNLLQISYGFCKKISELNFTDNVILNVLMI
jgi:hypothetical protein